MHSLPSSMIRGVAVLVLSVLCVQTRAIESTSFDYQRIVLENGLEVITLEDFSCPIVNVQLWYHVGSKDEDPERQGFAHMFEHMMFRGTDRLGPTDHFELIRKTGGTNNAYTSFDQTVYHQTVPADQLDLVLWLEAERMSFLKIDQEAFDTERQVVEEERRLSINRPYGTMPEKVLAELFKVHPYRWTPIGNIPHLRASSVPELRAFWTRFYVPNNATLVIVGAVEHEHAQELARRYFGWISRAADPPRVTVREPALEGPREITIQEENAPAPGVAIVFHTVGVGHEDDIPLQLLASILGGNESSRIYRKLVAEDESAVMAMAMAVTMEQHGIFGAGAVLPPLGGAPNEVLAELEAQVARLRDEPVSEAELDRARNQLLKQRVTERLTVESKASALGSAAVLEGDVANVNARYDAIRSATAADLQRVARKYLAENRTIMGQVRRNMFGALGAALGFKQSEEEVPISATPETDPPPPGRPGLVRPDGYPADPPFAELSEPSIDLAFESAALDNGMKLYVVENTEVPLVTIRLGLTSGTWTETKPGTANLALDMLSKGTTEHTEAELAEALDAYAITVLGSATRDDCSVTAQCLSEHAGRAVEHLAEVVRTPTFPEDEFRKLRTQTLTGLLVTSREPSYIADRELRRRLFGDHPYARTVIGEAADVQALTADDLRAWWTTHARPDRATLIFAGDIDLDRARALAEEAFGGWETKGPQPHVDLPEMPEPQSTRIVLVDLPGVQSQIRAGLPGITRAHPDYPVSQLVSGYFGGSFSARLNDTIRVQKGLTYGARGSYSPERLAGTFQINTFSKIESTVEAVQAILDEVRRLIDEPPSESELSLTKAYTVGSFQRQRETPQALARDLWLIESHGLPADYFSRLLSGIAGAGAGDCARLISKTVAPEKLVVVVVGPADQLKAGLEEIAPVTVVSAVAGNP